VGLTLGVKAPELGSVARHYKVVSILVNVVDKIAAGHTFTADIQFSFWFVVKLRHSFRMEGFLHFLDAVP